MGHAMVVLANRSWLLQPCIARLSRRKDPLEDWLDLHLTGQLGSFIAMTTAVMVVNFGNIWWAWAAPTIIGSPIIGWLKREVRAGRRPKYHAASSNAAAA
jgi:hypothetical protein